MTSPSHSPSPSLPPQRLRPSPDTILSQWHNFFNDPLLSLASIKSHGLNGKIPEKGLRSLYWRYYFSLLPSPSSPTSSTPTTYSLHLSRSRAEYTALRDTYLRSPDGGWVNDGEDADASGSGPKDGTGVGGTANGTGTGRRGKDVQVNNPLSLELGNPWSEWFEDLELRRTIRQDVQRTFPEIDYFRLSSTQDKLTNLLFIYCKLSPEIGYRQGMHELLAPLLWNVDFDSLPSPSPSPSTSDEELPNLVLSREFVEHDTWSLFSALMKSAKGYYDFVPSVALPLERQQSGAPNPTLSSSHAPSSSTTLSAANSTVLVQPIVGTAMRIHDKLLKILDKELWTKLESVQIEPQLYTIRYLRLLFGREFPLEEVMILWDGLFAEDSASLRLGEFITVAMLLRIRDALLGSEYSSCLQLLLRFPSPSDGEYKISLLLKQAVRLRDNISQETGEECRLENEKLGAVSGLEFLDRRDSYDSQYGDGITSMRRGGGGRPGMGRGSHGRTQSMGLGAGAGSAAAALFAEGGGLVGDLAKGVYGRAEALGINKAFFGTFNELRKSVNSPPPNGFSSLPSRPPWEDNRPSPTVNNTSAMRELYKLRSANVELSKALTMCIDVLEASHVRASAISAEKEEEEAEDGKEGEKEKEGDSTPSAGDGFMALTALKHVRDVLAGAEKSFDPNVLSPLIHSIETFPSPLPSSSPEIGSAPASPEVLPPTPPSRSPTIVPIRPPPAVTSAPLSRNLSSDSAGSARSSTGTPPLLGSGVGTPAAPASRGEPPPRASLSRTPLTNQFSTPSGLGFDRPLPARPIPPWESQKLGTATAATRRPSTSTPSTPSLPRLPPSASTRPGLSSRSTAEEPALATFPPTSFSVRPAGGARKTSIIDDPLGAAR